MNQTIPPHPLTTLYHFFSFYAFRNVSPVLSPARVPCTSSKRSWGSETCFPPCAQDNRSQCLPRPSPTSDIGIAAFPPAYGVYCPRATASTYMLVSAPSTASRSLIRQKPISLTAVFDPKAPPACRGFPQPINEGHRIWLVLEPLQVCVPHYVHIVAETSRSMANGLKLFGSGVRTGFGM
jgi:hypothetical protein